MNFLSEHEKCIWDDDSKNNTDPKYWLKNIIQKHSTKNETEKLAEQEMDHIDSQTPHKESKLSTKRTTNGAVKN